jgi:endonuclease/exonuclease/phosphatase family metal-dependent hydrolase
LSITGSDFLGQSLDDLSFGTPETLDVITWNIEWFPKNGQTTIDSVQLVLGSLDADIYALQEIDDTTVFRNMIDDMPGYETYFESFWFAGLAYVYKSDIQINDAYEIFYTEPYWNAFPRSPLVLEISYDDQDFVIIDNHFKCCGNGAMNINDPGDEETRRYEASNLLKAYIDEFLGASNVIVLGDLNDLLTDEEVNNVFQEIINDDEKYAFADMAIAEGSSSNWSYPSWPSHLDHILITNELFDDLAQADSDVETILVDDFMAGGFESFDSNLSDHRPVGMKLDLVDVPSNLAPNLKAQPALKVYPNPASNTLQIMLSYLGNEANLQLMDMTGQVVKHIGLAGETNYLEVDLSSVPSGIYILRLNAGETTSTTRVLVN